MITSAFVTLILFIFCVTFSVSESTLDAGFQSQLGAFPSNDSYVTSYAQYSSATNSTNIFVSGWKDNGSIIFSPKCVHTILSNDINLNSDIVALSSTSFVVTWETFGKDGSSTPSWGISATIIDGSGNTIIPQFIVPESVDGDQLDPKVVTTNSGFAVVWSSDQNILIKLYNSSGNNITHDITVNTISSQQGSSPQVVYHAASEIIFVVWSTSSQIKGQRVNSTGSIQDGNEVMLVSGTQPILLDIGTNLLLAWCSGTDISHKIINETWQFVSSTVQTNAITAGNQSDVQAAFMTSGMILMTWQSDNVDGDSTGIAARLFSTNGTAVSSQFLVNSNTTGAQTSPAVASLRSATGIITWTNQGSSIVGGIVDTTLQVINAALNRTWTEDTVYFFNSSAITVSALYESSVTLLFSYPSGAGLLSSITGISSSNAINNTLSISGSPANVTFDLQSLKFTPTANYDTTFNIIIQVINSANPTQTYLTGMTAIPTNDPPVIVTDQVSITEGSTITLGIQNITVSDDTPTNSLSFEVEYVSHGFFSINSSPTVMISSFTYTQLDSGMVLFTHDGSDELPVWTLTCFDGEYYSEPSNVTIISFIQVNDPPQVLINNFQLVEHKLMILNNTVLLITDDMTPLEGIIIWTFAITHGYFVNMTSNTTITQFTMKDVTYSLVGLQHDGSNFATSFNMTTTDGTFNVTIPPNITFVNLDDPPILKVYSPLTIYQGQILNVTSQILNATDPDFTIPDSQIQFFLSGSGTIGVFYIMIDGQKILTASVSQKNIEDGVVFYEHNNSTNAPSFNVTAFDSIALSDVISPEINFVILYNNTSTTSTGTPNDDSSSGSDKKTTVIAIAVSVVAVSVISLVVSVVLYVKRHNHRKEDRTSDPERDHKHSMELVPTPPRVSQTSIIKLSASNSEGPVASPERTSMSSYWEIDYSEIEIGRELGRGAFGLVYKARWRNSDCVVKQLNLSKSNEEGIKDFLKEAETVKKMRHHPNVCSVFGVCTNRNYPICIVMEYLSGGSLYDYIHKGKLIIDEELAIQIGKDVASGMSHLHQEGILHNDLACRNLLVTPRAEGGVIVKVADFGLAKKGQISSLPNQGRLPIRWTAPEVFLTSVVSTAADVWSFGVVLWELCQLELPYGTLSNQRVIEEVGIEGKRLNRPTRIEISDELWEIIQSCWKDSEERPSFNDLYQMLHQLQKQNKQHHKLNSIYHNASSDSETSNTASSPMQQQFMHYGRSTRQIQITASGPSDSDSDSDPQVTTASTERNPDENYNTKPTYPEIQRPFDITNQEGTYASRSSSSIAQNK